ncbi:unnamed protein product [Effrenium voratum]|nr:unnamed protein product [Effrenium voratum]
MAEAPLLAESCFVPLESELRSDTELQHCIDAEVDSPGEEKRDWDILQEFELDWTQASEDPSPPSTPKKTKSAKSPRSCEKFLEAGHDVEEQGELQSKTHLSFDIAHSPTPGYSPAQVDLSLDQELEGRIAVHLGRPMALSAVGAMASEGGAQLKELGDTLRFCADASREELADGVLAGEFAEAESEAAAADAAEEEAEETEDCAPEGAGEKICSTDSPEASAACPVVSDGDRARSQASVGIAEDLGDDCQPAVFPYQAAEATQRDSNLFEQLVDTEDANEEDGGEHSQSLCEEHADAIQQAASLRDACEECVSCRDEEDVLAQQPPSMAEASAETEHEETSELPQPSSPKQLSSELVAFEEEGLQEEVRVPCQDLSLDWSGFRNADMSPGAKSISAAAASEEAEEPADMSLLPDVHAASASPKAGAAASPMGSDGVDAAQSDVEEQADAAMEPEDKQRDSSHDVFEQLVQTVHEECESSRDERDAVLAQQLPHMADLQSSAQPASEEERPEGSEVPRRIVNHMRGFQGTLELHYADSEGESIECDAECSEPVASEQDEPDEDLTLTHSELSSARSDVSLEELADEAESQEPADAEDAATDEEAEDIEEGEAATEGLMDVPEGAAEEVFVNDSPEAAAASPFCSDEDALRSQADIAEDLGDDCPALGASPDVEEQADAAMEPEDKQRDSSHDVFEQLVQTVHEECESSRDERDAVLAQQVPHMADLQSSAQPASEEERPEGSEVPRRIVNHMRGFQGTLELHYADSEGESIECDAECSEPVASEQDEPDEDLTLTHSELSSARSDVSLEELADEAESQEPADAEDAATDEEAEDIEEGEAATEGLMDVPEGAAEEVFVNDSPEAAAASPFCSDDDCQPAVFPRQAAESDIEEPAAAMEPEDKEPDSSHNLFEQLVETEDASEEDGGEHNQSLGEEHADAIPQAACLRDACEECVSCSDEKDRATAATSCSSNLWRLRMPVRKTEGSTTSHLARNMLMAFRRLPPFAMPWRMNAGAAGMRKMCFRSCRNPWQKPALRQSMRRHQSCLSRAVRTSSAPSLSLHLRTLT